MAKQIEKVLLVDDDQNIRIVVQMALEGLTEWKVSLAESGMEALKLARDEKPDLILLDMMMPGMDGSTTYTQLREQKDIDAVPIIFMTAKVQTHEVENHMKLGAAGVIAKPFDPMTLHKEILRILDSLAS
jgi:two-component system, OmpR family, response regulator